MTKPSNYVKLGLKLTEQACLQTEDYKGSQISEKIKIFHAICGRDYSTLILANHKLVYEIALEMSNEDDEESLKWISTIIVPVCSAAILCANCVDLLIERGLVVEREFAEYVDSLCLIGLVNAKSHIPPIHIYAI
jgi:hypothetical protein